MCSNNMMKHKRHVIQYAQGPPPRALKDKLDKLDEQDGIPY